MASIWINVYKNMTMHATFESINLPANLEIYDHENYIVSQFMAERIAELYPCEYVDGAIRQQVLCLKKRNPRKHV